MKKKNLYPGTKEAERQKPLPPPDDEPDSYGISPNYDKFTEKGWSVEEVLVWFNID